MKSYNPVRILVVTGDVATTWRTLEALCAQHHGSVIARVNCVASRFNPRLTAVDIVASDGRCWEDESTFGRETIKFELPREMALAQDVEYVPLRTTYDMHVDRVVQLNIADLNAAIRRVDKR